MLKSITKQFHYYILHSQSNPIRNIIQNFRSYYALDNSLKIRNHFICIKHYNFEGYASSARRATSIVQLYGATLIKWKTHAVCSLIPRVRVGLQKHDKTKLLFCTKRTK